MNLIKTLDKFNLEYAELSKKVRLNESYLSTITDIYKKSLKIRRKIRKNTKRIRLSKYNAEEIKSNW